jgi:hypothetical protein
LGERCQYSGNEFFSLLMDLVTHQIDRQILLTFCILHTSLSSVVNIGSKLLCNNAVPHLEITHAKLPWHVTWRLAMMYTWHGVMGN